MRSIAARQRVCSGSGLQLRAADAPAPAPAPALAPGPTLQAAAPAPGLRLQLRLQLWPVEPRADSREVHFQPRSLLTQLSLSLSLHLRLSARRLLAGGRLPAPAGSSTELRPSHAPEGLRAGVIRHRHTGRAHRPCRWGGSALVRSRSRANMQSETRQSDGLPLPSHSLFVSAHQLVALCCARG